MTAAPWVLTGGRVIYNPKGGDPAATGNCGITIKTLDPVRDALNMGPERNTPVSSVYVNADMSAGLAGLIDH